MSNITIHEANTPSDKREFITFAWEIYKDDQYWVPPLISERVAFWDKKKNPFYEHSDAQMFMAKRDGRVVGTIAAILNKRHNEFHHEATGFYGGFECVNDQAVAAALFDAAKAWLKARNMNVMRGPATVSMNDEVGLLVDGFDGEPQVLMTYNPRYYQPLVEGYGFKKAMDLWAWWAPNTPEDRNISDKLARVAGVAQKRGKYTLRQGNLKQLAREVGVIRKIYASYEGAWKDNWGHVPMTDKELDHTVAGLKQFADEELIFVAEHNGEPIAFSIALPNVNRPLRAAYPSPQTLELITLLKFVWHRRTMVNSLRFILLGVLPEHRMAGVDAMLINATVQAAVRKKFIGGEMSWILETNDAMNRLNKLSGGTVYRTYRMYDVAI